MSTSNHPREFIYNYLAYLIIFLAFLYCSIRAYLLSITHDEAITFLIHASGSFSEIFTFALSITSNNHLINTVLIKILINIFSLSEFVMRIPALIGFGLYLLGTLKLLQLFLKRHFLLIGLCLLIFNPFMLDFFSLARGYSLALGFMTVGLYYTLKTITKSDYKQHTRNLNMACAMLLLAVLSQLAFITIYLSFITIFILMALNEIVGLIKRREPRALIFKRFLYRIIFIILPGLLILPSIYNRPVMKRITKYVEEYGGAKGLWEDTVTSLITATLYNKSYFDLNIIFLLKIIIALTLIISVSILLYKLIKRAEFKLIDRYMFLITAVLILVSSILTLFNLLFGIKYVIGRTALYFIPLWMILFVILLQQTREIQRKLVARLLPTIFYFFTIIGIIHFLNVANFTHCFEYKYDASTKDMMTYVVELSEGSLLQRDSIRMGVNWIYEPSINFYRSKHMLYWLKQVNRENPDGEFDIYYLDDNSTNRNLIKKRNLRVIKKFEITQTLLAVPGNTTPPPLPSPYPSKFQLFLPLSG